MGEDHRACTAPHPLPPRRRSTSSASQGQTYWRYLASRHETMEALFSLPACGVRRKRRWNHVRSPFCSQKPGMDLGMVSWEMPCASPLVCYCGGLHGLTA